MQGAEAMNAAIKGWGKGTIQDLKRAFDDLGIQHRENSPSPSASRDALINRFASRGGMINKVGFKFPRHMVFVHKGVGRGTTAAQAGSTSRKAKPWFNPIMEQDIEGLADIVANGQADMVVKNLLIN